MRLKYANDHDHFVEIKDWMRRTNPNSFYISKWNRLNSIHQKWARMWQNQQKYYSNTEKGFHWPKSSH